MQLYILPGSDQSRFARKYRISQPTIHNTNALQRTLDLNFRSFENTNALHGNCDLNFGNFKSKIVKIQFVIAQPDSILLRSMTRYAIIGSGGKRAAQ